MNIGYIRVSTKEQNIERQLAKMIEKEIAKENIFIDTVSGKNFERPKYRLMRDHKIRKGDLIYIDALDRLGRNYDEVIEEWRYITREVGADIIVLENEALFDSRKFKTMGDMGKLMEDQFLSLLSYVADQERKKILQRQKEGIAIAKSKGKHLGRPRFNLQSLSKEQRQTLEKRYKEWIDKKITGVQFASILELKKNTFYKIIKEYELSL